MSLEFGEQRLDPVTAQRDTSNDGRLPRAVTRPRGGLDFGRRASVAMMSGRVERQGAMMTVPRDRGRRPWLGDAAGRVAERDHELEIANGSVGAFAVGLVHSEDVGALEDPSLDGLDVVTHARSHHDEGRVDGASHFELVLSDADGLDEHHVRAPSVGDSDDVGCGTRQPA